MYDGARAPSPQDGANGFPQPGASTGRPKPEEEVQKPEPMPAKKAHREILDHERKRRVELKCMELQEMMEEQGYPEEEIRQKVGTFRQMLMEKEGVITREGSHRRQVVNHMTHGNEEEEEDDEELAEGYAAECDCSADCYDRDSEGHGDYRMKRKSSSSPSPPPKKRKKKKSGRHRSRFDSSSPPRREKKKKSGKKRKRDRSTSGLRKKRRYRSGSPKNKHKDKNKPRKRSPLDSPNRRSHRRGSCCSSRSASISSTGSLSKSPSRPTLKHRAEGHKARQSPSSHSTSLSPAYGAVPSAIWQNGHRDGSSNGRDSRSNHLASDKPQDKLSPLPASPSAGTSLSPHPKDRQAQGTINRSPGRQTDATSEDEEHRAARRSTSASSGKRGHRHRAPRKSSHSPARSSDSGRSQHSQTLKNKGSQVKKTRGVHSSKRRRRSRLHARHRSPSASSGRHRRHVAGRKESSSRSLRQRSCSWSSGRSASCSRSREHGSKAKSPHSRQNNSREKDGTHHTDAEGRTRRRSRSYSPIRKRRRDSPSFMEARRITRCPEDYRQRNATELQRQETAYPVLQAQPIVLQLHEQPVRFQPQPQLQLQQLQPEQEPEPEPEPLAKPQPQPQLLQPQQFGESRLLMGLQPLQRRSQDHAAEVLKTASHVKLKL
ncbi:serine/arginine repetitive matrix protein 3 isoform X2 [Scleropages formosus]|uniref:Serine/arginine repetitive matrix 3 n=1 Tax=Scleropages formosus TaxID=113540 RepID=A0A8C9T0K8_SCLFO|nr:serine/arginine repetitive matrix protein 3 isoform X2 [Scleropages formosus]